MPRRWWIVAGIAVAILAVVALRGHRASPPTVALAPASEGKKAASEDEGDADFSTRDANQRRVIRGQWAALIRWLNGNPRPTPEEIAARLNELRTEWIAMDPTVLAAVIAELLESGGDLPTGLKFEVGPHGFLKGWPTLRVFLLDVLAGSDMEAAVPVARQVLDSTASANEFAMAMRSLTRDGPARAGSDELVSRLGSMLGHVGWGNEPGFAAAFDLARVIGTPAAARTVAAWQGSRTLRAMALDEFAADHPAAVTELVTSPEAAALAPAERASLMARIDPADPGQLSAADRYLRDPALTAGEAEMFLKVFPLRSATTGYRLYGDNPAPYTKEGIVAGDRAALDQVNLWLADPTLAERYQAGLVPLQQRLNGWVKQAASR
ncbi:hypothetical protein llg_03280 [Luteolibacter sp. LG18]|nr:hypothetical protein llg_03280 [Luteolibacter sp. LG18]